MDEHYYSIFCRALGDIEGLSRDIAAETETLKSADHLTLIRHFDKVRDLYDRLGDVKKSLNETYDKLNRDYVPEAMRAAGVKSTRVEGIGQVVISHRYSATMLDKEKGFEWLREHGHEDLIQPTVNSQTLSAFAKNLMETESVELPPDVFKVGTSPFTSIRR